jgi:hypothetical protein
MKIKNTFKIIGIVLPMLGTLSCNEGFLDKNPLNAISSQTFWNSEGEVDMAVAGVYARLRNDFLSWQRPYLDCLTDNAFAHWGYFNMPAMTLGDVSANTGGAISKLYNASYVGIASCNFFMGNVDKASTVSEAKKNVVKGEVRFLRSLMYFDLVTSFGDVVLYKTAPENADASRIAKSPKAEVLTFIHEDLDFAIANLPDNAYTNGHAVKGSAMALKTRVLLYEERWADAAALAKQIMEGKKFSLATNYEGLFLTSGQTNNPEIMFSTSYLSPNSFHGASSGADIEYGWGSHLCPYQNLVDSYECIDGKPITESPLYNAANPGANRDPRLAYTVKLPTVNWPSGEPLGAPSVTGFNMQKYVDLSRAPFNYSKSNLTDQDMVHLRYADVLLMYAEAKNEATGPDETIYSAVNEVRARPGVNMPPVDQTKYSSKDLLREFIRHERRVEMALEGHRYFDIKRWRVAHIILPKIKNPSGVSLVFSEKHYLLPFQQSELDANVNLKQTTNY